jgi:hypothetical protein
LRNSGGDDCDNELKLNDPTIFEEFEVIRNTRNSLHDGGKYNETFKAFRGRLNGTVYHFKPGVHVRPLRAMDVLKSLWQQFKAIENF